MLELTNLVHVKKEKVKEKVKEKISSGIERLRKDKNLDNNDKRE